MLLKSISIQRLSKLSTMCDYSRKSWSSGSYGNRSYHYKNRDYDDYRSSSYRRNNAYSRSETRFHSSAKPPRRFYTRDIDYSKMSRNEVIEDLVKIEKHHVTTVSRNKQSNRIEDVIWCPKHMEDGEHCTGGALVLHHTCRACKRMAIHLVDKPGRPCLSCFGWREADIPSWYYHKPCKYCRKWVVFHSIQFPSFAS